MIKRIFKLWDNHTIGFVRVLFLLLLPSAVSDCYGTCYCCVLLLLWLIVKTGYEKKWDKETNDER